MKELKIDARKVYTGDPVGPWRHDDEKVAYPFYDRTLKLGVRNICTHKGLPLPGPGKDFFRPDDVLKAAKDWPDINFIVFHSGMQHMMTTVPPGESGMDPDGNIPWTTEFCQQIRESGVKNIYLELGAVFGHSVVTHPEVCGHLLGQVGRLQRQVLSPRGLSFTGLSDREIQVLRLIADGLDTNEIASQLCYSQRTVKNVLHDVTSRLQLRNRSHAVAYAVREGLI